MDKIIVGGLLFTIFLFGQITNNPDFSVIGDLIIDQSEDGIGLYSAGIEMAIQGYVNPFARVDVYLHKHNDESALELEESVITIERGLPLGLGLRAGKFRPDIGKINKDHAHLFPFIQAPKSMASILGEEFWAPTGFEGNILLPLPWYTKLSIGYFDEGFEDHMHDMTQNNDGHMQMLNDKSNEYDDYQGKDEEGHSNGVLSGRWSHFIDLNDVTHLELGTSGYSSDEKSLVGTDLKFKWRPNKYRSLIIQGEVFQLNENREAHENDLNSQYDEENDKVKIIGYTFISYQFNKAWNMGLIGDFSTFDISENEEDNHVDKSNYNFALFFGYSPVEESSVLRIRIAPDGDDINLMAQLVWSLGPHKPHRY